MEISQEDFDVVQSVIGISQLYSDQASILESVGFDYKCDCEDFLGTYFPDDEWRLPDPDLVLSYLESVSNQSKERLKKYRADHMLTSSEVEGYKLWRRQDFRLNENSLGYFIGKLSCESKELTVFMSSSGCGFEGVEYSLLGVFRSEADGVATLFPDGELVGV